MCLHFFQVSVYCSARNRAAESQHNQTSLNKHIIMARLFGIEIPNEKRIEASLCYIYGIGPSTAKKVLEQAGISPDLRTGTLSDAQLTKIVQAITSNNILIEGDLRREKQLALKRLTSINCLRGIRHRKGLPVRGQRTRTNARTRKGRKKTVGAKK